METVSRSRCRFLPGFMVLLGILAMEMSLLSGTMAAPTEEALEDVALEERAREISKGLRCVVCKNQSINESSASLAKDLRILVRERLKEGYTDEEVVDYIVGSYGEFILLKPRFSAKNMILWISPFVVFLGGAILAISFLRGQKLPDQPVRLLSDEEQETLQRLAEGASPSAVSPRLPQEKDLGE